MVCFAMGMVVVSVWPNLLLVPQVMAMPQLIHTVPRQTISSPGILIWSNNTIVSEFGWALRVYWKGLVAYTHARGEDSRFSTCKPNRSRVVCVMMDMAVMIARSFPVPRVTTPTRMDKKMKCRLSTARLRLEQLRS